MKIEDKLLIRLVGKKFAWLCALILACKLTGGLATVALVLVGVHAAATNKLGRALSCYVLFPLLVIMNPYVASIGGTGGLIVRLGFFLMTFMMMMFAGRRRGNQQIPFGGLWIYAFVAVISSMGGYAPTISYLKLINFSVLLCGIWLGLRNIDQNPDGLMNLRAFLLAMACVVIFGSIATLKMGSAAYFASIQSMINSYGIDGASEILAEGAVGNALFCGITNQSQCMGPLAVMTISWVICDMLFVEHRITTLHSALILGGLPLLYLTRSRTALCAMIVAVFVIYTYCFKMMRVSPRVKRAVMSGMTGLFALIAVGAIVMEVRDRSISRWIRKTDDVSGDQRSLTEAVTASRMGLVEQNMYDFRRNPLLGSGFQVAYDFQFRYKPGQLVISAPIEKGVLPTMILGETGVIGAIAFSIFLLMFYGTCTTRRYAVTATLFTVLMASNMGEATFFSAGGTGGILWIVGIVGGFCVDMIVRMRKLRGEVPMWR